MAGHGKFIIYHHHIVIFRVLTYAFYATVLACALVGTVLLPAFAAEDSHISLQFWHIAYGTGQYHHIGYNDRIFKLYYNAVNATISKFSFNEGGFSAEITNATNGRLDVLFPRNYPTNTLNQEFVLFIDDIDVAFNSSQVKTTDCFYDISLQVNATEKVTISQAYLLSGYPYFSRSLPDGCSDQTLLLQNVPHTRTGSFSPIQQMKAGVSANDVLCEGWNAYQYDYFKFFSPTGKPYCVTMKNQHVLKSRGWTAS